MPAPHQRFPDFAAVESVTADFSAPESTVPALAIDLMAVNLAVASFSSRSSASDSRQTVQVHANTRGVS